MLHEIILDIIFSIVFLVLRFYLVTAGMFGSEMSQSKMRYFEQACSIYPVIRGKHYERLALIQHL